jgi:hypothetical protein
VDAQLDIMANFFIAYKEDGVYVDDIYKVPPVQCGSEKGADQSSPFFQLAGA